MAVDLVEGTVTPISQDDFDRIDKVLSVVIDQAGEFTDFEVDFAMRNANRLDEFQLYTRFSDSQWGVLERLEKKIEEMD